MIYTKFEQEIFDRSLKNYKNKHGDHPSGPDIFYITETHKTDMWDQFWNKYLNSEKELL